MGDRVAVLKGGILQQCASPRELYDAPDNAFVATFIGSPAMNMIAASVVDGGAQVNDFTIPIERDVLAKASGSGVLVGVRPEDLHLADQGIEMTVTLVEELGADTYVYGNVRTAEGGVDLVARSRGFNAPAIGSMVRVSPDRTYVFDTAGEQPRIS